MIYNRILVAVDGSDVSNRALQEGLKLTKDQQGQLRIVHTVDTVLTFNGSVYMDYDAYRRSALEGGQEVIDQAIAMARQAGVQAEAALIEMTTNNPSAAILDEAKRWSADIIVIGTHGRSGLQHLLMGSVAEGVIRHAPVPVLLVRGS